MMVDRAGFNFRWSPIYISVPRRFALVCLLAFSFAHNSGAQSTLYWAGNANDPGIGGDGIWTYGTADQSWSSDAGTYIPVSWSNRVNNTDSAVLGGGTSGIITLDRSIHGTSLVLARDYTINLPSIYATMSFENLIFTGSAARLTLTGPGAYSGGLESGTVVLAGDATKFIIKPGPSSDANGTIIAQSGTFVRNELRASAVSVQLHGSAALQGVGGNASFGPVSSANPGDGVIENGHGMRESMVTINVASGSVTYSGVIRDSSSGPQPYGKLKFAKSGAGELVLAGAQKTHTGSTIVWDGTLRLASEDVLPAGRVLDVYGGTLALDADQGIGSLSGSAGTRIQLGGFQLTVGGGDIAGVVSDAGRLVKTGADTLWLSGNNTYSGGTLVEGGALVIGHASALGIGPVTFKAGSSLAIGVGQIANNVIFESGEVVLNANAYADRIFSGVISGAATIDVRGGGYGLTLTGTNTFTGGTRITGTTLTIGSDSALGDPAGAVAFDNGKLQWSQAFDLAPTRAITLTGENTLLPNGFSTTLTQDISGSGSLQIASSGTVNLTGHNGFSGGLKLDGGTLVVDSDAALGATDGSIILSEGTLRFTTSVVLGTTRSLKIEPYTIGAFTTNGIAVDAGAVVTIPVPISNYYTDFLDKASLVKTGAGTLRLTAPSTYDGSTYVKGGVLQLGVAANTLPVGQQVDLSGGKLDLDGNAQTVDRITGGSQVLLNGGSLTMTTAENTIFYGGFAGAGTVRKTGAGKFELYANGQFAGIFRLDAGTLYLTSGNHLGIGSKLLMSADTALYGFGSIDELEVSNGATVSPGALSGAASITTLGTGNATWATGSRYIFQLRSIYSYYGPGVGRDSLAVTGRMDVTATTEAPMVIEVVSADVNSNPGLLSGFNSAQDYALSLITTTDGIFGVTATNVVLDLSGFQNSYGGTFRLGLANEGRDLNLVYRGRNLANWGVDHFLPGELADPEISGPAADPDRDGFPNLVEYALGFDPRVVSATGLPETTATATDWVYTYVRPTLLSDVTYTVEASTDLVAWTTANVIHEKVSSTTESEVWRARYPLVLAENLFFRLKVTQP